METIVRLPETLYDALTKEVTAFAGEDRETFLFLLLQRVETPTRRLYLGRSVVLLDEGEAVREALRTYPTEACCRRFYGVLKEAKAFQQGLRVGAVHSHPFAQARVAFSAIDLSSFKADQEVFRKAFGVELVALVFNREASAFDGLVIEPDGSHPIDQLQIMGSTFHRLRRSGAEEPALRAIPVEAQELYRRMRLIPSWDYGRCADVNITLVGLGGLGSTILQQLTLLGIGERGVTTLIDGDIIEPSNRSRIPYAVPQDDGVPKVTIGARYVETMRPGRRVRPLILSVFDEEAQSAIAESDLVIGAVDSELARLALNHLAHAFCVPYFDGGAGILVQAVDGEPVVHSGGQVRLVVPGMTPGLCCNLGIDRAEVDRELMEQLLRQDAKERATLERSGYIRGLGPQAEQPSVAHLNFLVAGGLTTELVKYLLEGLPPYQALHLNLEELEWLKSVATRRPFCSLCGDEQLGSGRWFQVADLTVPLTLRPEEIA